MVLRNSARTAHTDNIGVNEVNRASTSAAQWYNTMVGGDASVIGRTNSPPALSFLVLLALSRVELLFIAIVPLTVRQTTSTRIRPMGTFSGGALYCYNPYCESCEGGTFRGF